MKEVLEYTLFSVGNYSLTVGDVIIVFLIFFGLIPQKKAYLVMIVERTLVQKSSCG